SFQWDADLPVAEPAPQTRIIPIALAERGDLPRDLTVDKTKAAGIERHRHSRHEMKHAVERGEQRTLEQTLLAHRTNAVHDIESLAPPGEKRSDTRGIILQVRVHHDHD